jgi:hypothetical protein
MAKRAEIKGKIFGRLTVLEYSHSKGGRAQWICQCECGSKKIVSSRDLGYGSVKSCNCLRRDRTIETHLKHGHSRRSGYTKEFKSWEGMINRCYSPNSSAYSRYGGRGIKVCDRWLVNYENFLADMGECPKGLTLERINNDGNYESLNCKWATRKEQAANTRKTIYYEYKGQEYMQIDFAELLDIPNPTLSVWRRKGLSMNQIIEKSLERMTWIPNL